MVHLSPVQHFLGSQVSHALADKFDTKVTVGSVNLGFFNRIIIDDVMMYDQKGDSMIYASRISAKVSLLPLLNQKISIASAQLFGLKANLYQQTPQSKHNFQFVLDSLASKDTTKHTPLDLHIGSLIIRHGAVKYDNGMSPLNPEYSRLLISASATSRPTSLPITSLMMISICISRN